MTNYGEALNIGFKYEEKLNAKLSFSGNKIHLDGEYFTLHFDSEVRKLSIDTHSKVGIDQPSFLIEFYGFSTMYYELTPLLYKKVFDKTSK